MGYSLGYISNVKAKAIAKINMEFSNASDSELDELIKKYDLRMEDNPINVNIRTMKILVLGALAGKKKDYIKTLHSMDINENNVEFVDDYSELKRFDARKLEYSTVYSDIICGPNPHKQIGIEDSSSLLALLEKEPNKYPRVIRAVANSSLKLSQHSFKQAIINTRYYEEKFN